MAFPSQEATAKPVGNLQAASRWRVSGYDSEPLVVGERRKPSTQAQAAAFVARLKLLPMIVDDETDARAWGDTLHLARAHTLSAYDAAYLELAMRRGLPLAPLDHQLKASAKAVGVPLFVT